MPLELPACFLGVAGLLQLATRHSERLTSSQTGLALFPKNNQVQDVEFNGAGFIGISITNHRLSAAIKSSTASGPTDSPSFQRGSTTKSGGSWKRGGVGVRRSREGVYLHYARPVAKRLAIGSLIDWHPLTRFACRNPRGVTKATLRATYCCKTRDGEI